jgi:hypothetical protein
MTGGTGADSVTGGTVDVPVCKCIWCTIALMSFVVILVESLIVTNISRTLCALVDLFGIATDATSHGND